ncbi:MAG TPA: hypothetical protein VN327_02140 [Pseudonocardiaceae bacterium]|nr:hypothetical protein [Pseudonocardiaceae bacterium]
MVAPAVPHPLGRGHHLLSSHRKGDVMPGSQASSPAVAQRRYAIAITCCLDGQAHDVTDENVVAGRHAGEYLAECGHRVVAAAMAAPVGRPCARCTAVSVAARPTAGPVGRARHRRPGRLWRMLHPGSGAGASARWLA